MDWKKLIKKLAPELKNYRIVYEYALIKEQYRLKDDFGRQT